MGAVPAVLAAAAIVYLPGGLLAWVGRLPPLVIAAVAAPLGILTLAVSALTASLLGVRWGWVAVLSVLALFVVTILLVRRQSGGRPEADDGVARPGPSGPDVGEGEFRRRQMRVLGHYGTGIAIAALVLAPAVLSAMESPTHFPQRFDTVFHLNVSQYVASTGSASPFDFADIGSPSFYPAAWHAWVGLLVQLTGVPVTVASQACTLVTLFLVIPLGLSWLSETWFMLSPAGRLLVGPLSFASVAFPFSLLSWGTFYANLLGIALAPAALAAGWEALGRRRPPMLSLNTSITIALAAVTATALAHPNAALGVGLILTPAAVAALIPAARLVVLGGRPTRRATSVRGTRWWTVGVCAALLVFVFFWVFAASRIGPRVQDAFIDPLYGIVEITTGTALNNPWTPVLTIGLLAGFYRAWRHRDQWPLLIAYGLVAGLYYQRAAFGSGGAWGLLLAPFYNDPFRIAAVGALLTIPLAVSGWDWIARLAARWSPTLAATRRIAAVTLSAVLAVSVLFSPGFRNGMAKMENVYEVREDSLILSPDELALIERIPSTVPEDAAVVVNPWEGGALVYALADRGVTLHYMPESPDVRVREINERLNEVADDPDVCVFLAREGAQYVLQLEPEYIQSVHTPPEYPGLSGYDESEGFELVDSEGESALYRITACDDPGSPE